MRDMKVEPFLLASTLRGVIAQLLLRRLCPACRQPGRAPQALAARLGFEIGTIVYQPVGCELCNGTRFKGRTGVFEMIPVDDTIRRLLQDGCDEALIHRHSFLHSHPLCASAPVPVGHVQTTAMAASPHPPRARPNR